MHNRESSNGRTVVFEAMNAGSNPASRGYDPIAQLVRAHPL